MPDSSPYPQPGTNRTPEYTQAQLNPYPVGSAANGGTMYSDGSIRNVPQVLGTQNQSYANQSMGGGGGGGSAGGGSPQSGGFTPDGSYSVGYNGSGNGSPGSNIPSYEDQMRGQIEGGYNSYFNELDNMMNSLPGQAENQQGVVNSQLNQGTVDLTGQRDIGMNDLARNTQQVQSAQASSLKDVGANIGNLMRAGNVYLGTRGAGDSSAADQMSYAYGKLGSQQRGQVMKTGAESINAIKDREFKLNTTYNTALSNLKSEAEQKKFQIAQWLGEQQNNIRQMKASGQLQKGQDMANLTQNFLNIALQQAQAIQSEAANKRAMLDQWAMNNSQSISQLKANMGMIYADAGQLARPSYTSQNFSAGANTGNSVTPAVTGYGYSTQDKLKQLA
jgi:hypothetical protein